MSTCVEKYRGQSRDLAMGRTYPNLKKIKSKDIEIIKQWALRVYQLEKLKDINKNITIRVYSKENGEERERFEFKRNDDKCKIIEQLQCSAQPVSIFIDYKGTLRLKCFSPALICLDPLDKELDEKKIKECVRKLKIFDEFM
jgi:hypothetical protein